MSLLKNVVKNSVGSAISQGVSKVGDGIASGIAKGVSSAVGSAVEKTVAPTADKLAGKAADKLNETAASVSSAMDATAAAANQTAGSMAEAAAGANQAAAAGSMAAQAAGTQAAAPAGSGFASLAGTLTGMMGNLEAMATEAAASIKICPKCGEGAPAGTKFCPKCGTALPEQTIGDQYICPKCGKRNTPGVSFCTECGAILPLAEKELAEQKAKDDAVLEQWKELLPDYPLWNGAGKEYKLEYAGESNGQKNYYFYAEEVTYEMQDAYTMLLKENGFVRPEGYTTDNRLIKTVAGVCRTIDLPDDIAEGGFALRFYTSDLDKPKTAKASATASEGVAAAKKVLGKLFG